MSLIKDFYKGQTLLITGATGFMGKVLLEKLLRSLPEIEKIYVLLRPKKGLTPAERIKEITSKPPFTFNGIEEPHFKKLVAVQADVTQEDLGLSEEARAVLVDEVSIVFHLAASVRMNLSLRDAIVQNTLATLRVLEMCEEMKKLACVIHLSTAYCNIEVDFMEEKIYRMDLEPLEIIHLVQHLDEESLKRMEQNILKVHPNTYTFSKRLAEIVAWDYGKRIPIVICRPSIVTPSLKEPTPGWVDSFNGPIGIFVAAGKGVIRSVIADRNCEPEMVPVDIAINSLIVCGWFRTVSTFSETPVYNVTQSNIKKCNWGYLCDKFTDLVLEYPYQRCLWYPACRLTTNIWLHSIIVLLFHMIPAYFTDFLLVVFKQKPFMVNIQNRLNTGTKLLKYFTVKPWTFTNAELMKIKECLTSYDSKEFYLFEEITDVNVYIRNCFFGARKFCLKESLDGLFFQKVIYRILICLEYAGRIALGWAVLWLTLYLFNVSHLLSWEYWKYSTSIETSKLHRLC